MLGDGNLAAALLVNTGSPAAPAPKAVREYLSSFLMDPCVRPMPALPWHLILHAFILPRRARASAAKYAGIWRPEGSPLVVTSRSLARKVEARLQGELGERAPLVRAAMSYGEPGIEGVLADLRAAGVGRLVVVPMYPQSAHSTTDAVLGRLWAALSGIGWEPQVAVVRCYGDEPAYLDGLADSARAAGFDPARDRLLLSFHSIPQPDIRAGDTYCEQVERSCSALLARLGAEGSSCDVAFQSPFEDQRTWQGPFTAQVLPESARRCGGRLFVACPGFAVDCLETLYDVQQVLRARAEEVLPEGSSMVYVPCLNDGAAQVGLMSGLIRRALQKG